MSPIDNKTVLVQVMAWRRTIITHTSDSHQTPSQNKQSQSYKFKKKIKFWNLIRNFTHDTPSEVAW